MPIIHLDLLQPNISIIPADTIMGERGTMLILPNNTLVAKKTYIISTLLDLKFLF